MFVKLSLWFLFNHNLIVDLRFNFDLISAALNSYFLDVERCLFLVLVGLLLILSVNWCLIDLNLGLFLLRLNLRELLCLLILHVGFVGCGLVGVVRILLGLFLLFVLLLGFLIFGLLHHCEHLLLTLSFFSRFLLLLSFCLAARFAA